MYYHYPSQEHINRIKQITGGSFEVVIADSKEKAKQGIRYSDIIFGAKFLRYAIKQAQAVKWVQGSGAGFDQLPLTELKKKGILLTRTTFSNTIVARHVYTMAWSLIRRLPTAFSCQQRGEWIGAVIPLPEPKTALILGLGSIGKELAFLLKKDGLWVCGVKRTLDASSARLCDQLLGPESWMNILPKIDLCFLTLPLNKNTAGIFGAKALALLPAHAVVINVGRGDLLDEYYLVKMLKEGRLGGAGLDVVSPGLLRKNTALWRTQNLLITPHIAAHYPQRPSDLERFCEQQLVRYINNEPLENLVNLDEEPVD